MLPERRKAAGTGKVEVLPEVSRRFAVDGETFIEPRAAVGGFVGFDDLTALNPTVTDRRAADVQLKAEAGVAFGVKDGSSLQATGGVESGSCSNVRRTGRDVCSSTFRSENERAHACNASNFVNILLTTV